MLKTVMATAAAALVLTPASAALAVSTPSTAVEEGVARDGAPGPIDLVGLDFQLINGGTGGCLAQGGGVSIVEQRCATVPAQRWRFAPAGLGNVFELRHARTGKCLTARTSTVVLDDCGSDPSKRWRMIDSVDPYAQLQNLATGRCLSPAPGVDVAPFRCDNDRDRRWTVRVVSLPFLPS